MEATTSLTGSEAADAARRVSQALASRPDYPEAARLLAALMQRYEFNAETELSPRGLEAAFGFATVDRQALSEGTIAYLKSRPPLADVIARGRGEGWDAAAASLLRKGARLLRERLFAAALVHGVVTDIEIEELLTAFRRQLLLSSAPLARPVYEFACVLLRQCLNNEHVFFVQPDETERLIHLDVDIDALIAGDAAAGGALLLRSLYRPVHETLRDEARATDRVSPRALRAVLRDELAARRAEAAWRDRLPELTPVTDDTSRRVADQYENDPYPRWLSLQAPHSGSARDGLADHFSTDDLKLLEAPYDVLVAGAGTGRQAIQAALGHGAEATVLAIDVSAPSLAYGARMAEALGVENLRFAVGDILGLDDSVGPFEVIECVGVLHHMADPFAGWRALLDRLRPGGLMLVGLYSALARGAIHRLSDDPAWPGGDADDAALRAYRRVLTRRESDGDAAALATSVDFFTKSGFRDLALHVSEQVCTIPEIDAFLAANGLDFHGFRLSDDSRRAYGEAFPEDALPGTLEHWWGFEQAHPRTFAGMYLFWCRKA